MEDLEVRILAKRQDLRDRLVAMLAKAPVYLPVVKELRLEITVCDLALKELNCRQVKSA